MIKQSINPPTKNMSTVEEINNTIYNIIEHDVVNPNPTMSAISQETKIMELEQEVTDLKHALAQVREDAAYYEELYDDACNHIGKNAKEYAYQISQVRELQKENYNLLSKILELESEPKATNTLKEAHDQLVSFIKESE